MMRSRLIVDLDGTLTPSDCAFESLVDVLFHAPLAFLCGFIPHILRGRAAFKIWLAALSSKDWSLLPLNEDFLSYLKAQKGEGREIHLVTATTGAIAEIVAAQAGVFNGVHGSDGARNLKGKQKLAYIKEYLPGPFAYAADAHADIPIWREASSIILVHASGLVETRARRLGVPIEKIFSAPSRFAAWMKAARLHQWSKNFLIFVPLFLSHLYQDSEEVSNAILGFLLLSAAASASYLINDLADLDADRKHRVKHTRPLAKAALPIGQVLILSTGTVLFSLALAFWLKPAFGIALGSYILLTLSYSFFLKKKPLLDAVVLAALYTLRIVMGVILIDAVFSAWLLTFSMFLFFSLAMAKRYVELAQLDKSDLSFVSGRGYQAQDAPLVLALGAATTAGAVLLFVIYLLNEAVGNAVYDRPALLWIILIAVALWLLRIWLLALRGKLDDDPVAFAVRDGVSISLGLASIMAFAIALIS